MFYSKNIAYHDRSCLFTKKKALVKRDNNLLIIF